MNLKEKDRLAEAVELLEGCRDACIVFEERKEKEIPLTVFIVIETVLEKAAGLLKGLQEDS